MPELPEVEVIRRELEPLLQAKVFARPEILAPATVAAPSAGEFAAELPGRRVDNISRRGKYLLFDLDCGILAVHLRMTGNLLYRPAGEALKDPFLRLVLPFTDGSSLLFSDMRRFGRVWLLAGEDQLKATIFKNTGPDYLTGLNRQGFRERLAGRGRSRIKALLLDQGFAAGLGNIYTDECLFRAGLHPLRRCSTISSAECDRLYEAIGAVLQEGIEHGGTTFRDYRNARGALGSFQSRLNVYGRKGKLCRCGTEIKKTTVAGRGTHFCPRCQGEGSP